MSLCFSFKEGNDLKQSKQACKESVRPTDEQGEKACSLEENYRKNAPMIVHKS